MRYSLSLSVSPGSKGKGGGCAFQHGLLPNHQDNSIHIRPERPEYPDERKEQKYSPTSYGLNRQLSITLPPSFHPCQFAEMLRQRRPAGEEPDPCSGTGSSSHAAASEPGVIEQTRAPGYQPGGQQPLLKTDTTQAARADGMTWVQRNHWIVLAVASGACAAFNGVFAKLYVVFERRLAQRPLILG